MAVPNSCRTCLPHLLHSRSARLLVVGRTPQRTNRRFLWARWEWRRTRNCATPCTTSKTLTDCRTQSSSQAYALLCVLLFTCQRPDHLLTHHIPYQTPKQQNIVWPSSLNGELVDGIRIKRPVRVVGACLPSNLADMPEGTCKMDAQCSSPRRHFTVATLAAVKQKRRQQKHRRQLLYTPNLAVQLYSGELHNCVVMDDNEVKCWGREWNGRLGAETNNQHGHAVSTMGAFMEAVNVGTGRTVQSMSLGHSHTCALLDDASVKCWGRNAEGQLGQGDTADRGGAANQMGDNLPAIDLGTGRTATQVSAGKYFTCALLDDASPGVSSPFLNAELRMYGRSLEKVTAITMRI